MAKKPSAADIELKFDGPPIRELGGAPADAVASSLLALQRLVHLIGMHAEGRPFGLRAKPSAKVRRDFAVICRPTKNGSHIQPLGIAARSGQFTASAALARVSLLRALSAFDSGDDTRIVAALPNPRQRWFMADAAAGLLQPEESGIQVTVRAGSRGPFNFKADRARVVIDRLRSGKPPQADNETVVGKLKVVDYARSIVTIQPVAGRSVKFSYPPQLEPLIQANARRRVSVVGDATVNATGDITNFRSIRRLQELEPSLDPVEGFDSGGQRFVAAHPLTLPISFDFEDRTFVFLDQSLGIATFESKYGAMRDSILGELDFLWSDYACAPDEDLAEEALVVKRNLLGRFRVAT